MTYLKDEGDGRRPRKRARAAHGDVHGLPSCTGHPGGDGDPMRTNGSSLRGKKLMENMDVAMVIS